MLKTVLLFIALFFVATITAQQTHSSSATVCDVCTTVVSQLEQYVNQSEPEIEKALVKLCSKLPPQIEGLCDTIVLVYGHQIIQAILKKQTPDVVCKALRLCPKNSIVEETAEPMSNNLQCTLCKLLVSAAEQYISQNKTEQQILDALHKVCDNLPSLWRSQCKSVVDQYTPQILEYLKQRYPPEKICQMIKLCPTSVAQEMPVEESPVPVTNDYCDLCLQVVQWVEDYIEDNRTSAKIIEALTKVCNMTGQYEAMCKALIPVIWQQLVQKIRDQEPPRVVCKQLHLCANSLAAQKFSSDLTCNGCKYLVAVVDNFIRKETTEQKIIETVEKACNYFPSQYKGLCQAVIEQYGPQIIELLVKKILDPTKVCTAVRACKAQVHHAEGFFAGLKINLN